MQAGGKPVVEIMIPLTIAREEMAVARGWVEQAIADAGKVKGVEVLIGTMIEVPRAALRAEGMAEFAEFFSFGTNDLTQMTLGFSRDDIEGRIMTHYVEQGLLKTNPFETLDTLGVGELVRMACERGRKVRPDIKLGVCGEHGGDPDSIAFFYAAGLDYVSCSPFRVPIARLAAAQAVIGTGGDTR
ncbi:MAG TPA: putative PEP-binding protein [Acidimicrobiia bacterium]|nr:putative PEP-binding protein [Acidimicrobiia bacterium]